jgi:hypothetical protein
MVSCPWPHPQSDTEWLQIAHEAPAVHDGTLIWRCTHCGTRWPTDAPAARPRPRPDLGTPSTKPCLWPHDETDPESMLIGHEVPEVYDGVLLWQCVHCKGSWPRFTDDDDPRLHAAAIRYLSSS